MILKIIYEYAVDQKITFGIAIRDSVGLEPMGFPIGFLLKSLAVQADLGQHVLCTRIYSAVTP